MNRSDFKYLGAVRFPAELSNNVSPNPDQVPEGRNSDGFNYGGQPFAVDFARKEYVACTRYWRFGRLQMVEPKIIESTDPWEYPVASFADNGLFLDYSNLTWKGAAPESGAWPGPIGLLPVGDRLVVTANLYYDANNLMRKALMSTEYPVHEVRPVELTSWKTAGDPVKQGYIAGPCAPIPKRYQEALKGDVMAGCAMLPIITRLSAGPCAFSFWAKDVLEKDVIETRMMVGYPTSEGGMPGHPWGGPASDLYNMGTSIRGMAIIGELLVFIGYHGYGPSCYGNSTGDPAIAGTPDPDTGEKWCFDPVGTSKGNHAYPYRMQCWTYPMTDIISVVNGERKPWELMPSWFPMDDLPIYPHQYYGHGESIPGAPPVISYLTPNGMAYDEETNRLHIAVFGQDGHGWEPMPLVHVLEYLGTDSVEPPIESPPEPPIESPPEPPIESPPEPPIDACAGLRRQVVSLTLALDAETQRHNETKMQLGEANTRLSLVNTEATQILNHNAGLKPKDKLPKWCVDAVHRIQNLSVSTMKMFRTPLPFGYKEKPDNEK